MKPTIVIIQRCPPDHPNYRTEIEFTNRTKAKLAFDEAMAFWHKHNYNAVAFNNGKQMHVISSAMIAQVSLYLDDKV